MGLINGLDFGETSKYFSLQKIGVPLKAEKIPFEPDLDNASVGNAMLSVLFTGDISKGMPPFLICETRHETIMK
jgi:hypothetical protein